MEFTYAHSGAAVFFLVEGCLTVDADLQTLRTAIVGIADPKVRGIFLDLAEVTKLDCSGIGELTRLHRLVAASGRAFGLVNVGRRERRMLEMVGLSFVLVMHDSASQALESMPKVTPRTSSERPGSLLRLGRESRGPQLPLSCESTAVGS